MAEQLRMSNHWHYKDTESCLEMEYPIKRKEKQAKNHLAEDDDKGTARDGSPIGPYLYVTY